MIMLFVWFFLWGTLVQGQIVAYTLTYSSTDCTGVAGTFKATNKQTCAPAACSPLLQGSSQGFCYNGTIESLGNPIECPGCAYCGYLQYMQGTQCTGTWLQSQFIRLGTCVYTPPTYTIFYGCRTNGVTTNFTEYSDARCTQLVTQVPSAGTQCVTGAPQCYTSLAETGYCSYTNLFTGGGAGNGNGSHGAASAVGLSGHLWACAVFATAMVIMM